MRISFRDLELAQCFIFSNKRASFSAVKLPPSPRAIETILIFWKFLIVGNLHCGELDKHFSRKV